LDFLVNSLHWIQSLGIVHWIQSLSLVAIIVLFTTLATLLLGVSSYVIFKFNNRAAQKNQANPSTQFYRRVYFDSKGKELINDKELIDDEKTDFD